MSRNSHTDGDNSGGYTKRSCNADCTLTVALTLSEPGLLQLCYHVQNHNALALYLLNQRNTRPPAIGLTHELIHAKQAAYGRMRRGNPGGPDARNPDKPSQVPHYELEVIGVHLEHSYAYTENKLRAE